MALALIAGAVLLVNTSPEAESVAETPDPVDSGSPSDVESGTPEAAPTTDPARAEPAERTPADIDPAVDGGTEGSDPPSPTTTTTTTTATTTTTVAPVPFGSYTVEQVIDGTIGAGDGANPNEEAPMGLHEAPLYLPQAWSWAQGPTRNGAWGQLGTGSSRFTEFRCAVIPEFGHRPPVDFRVNFRNGSYYQYVNGTWEKAFDVQLEDGRHGAYMGRAGELNSDPFASGRGSIQWREEPDGSFSA